MTDEEAETIGYAVYALADIAQYANVATMLGLCPESECGQYRCEYYLTIPGTGTYCAAYGEGVSPYHAIVDAHAKFRAAVDAHQARLSEADELEALFQMPDAVRE